MVNNFTLNKMKGYKDIWADLVMYKVSACARMWAVDQKV
jgi:hypothetical protein